jgi:hypothetical protein
VPRHWPLQCETHSSKNGQSLALKHRVIVYDWSSSLRLAPPRQKRSVYTGRRSN